MACTVAARRQLFGRALPYEHLTYYGDLSPTVSSERVQAIDIIRGLALFGVLLVNILSDFRIPLLEHIFNPYAGSTLNRLVDLAVNFFLEFKSLTTFSFLFGVGIAIQTERAGVRGVSPRLFLLRRLSILFLVGITHLFLIWNGDILTLYSLCGLVLLLGLNLPWRLLLVVGALLLAVSEFVPLFDFDFPTRFAAQVAIAHAREVYGSQGYLAILHFRWQETWTLIIPVLTSVLARTAGLMYLGVAAWRYGILQHPELHRKKLFGAMIVGGLLGAILTANDLSSRFSGHVLWPTLRHTHLDPSILLAIAYVSGLLLFLTPRRAAWFPGLAALGRMALTNYLLQSILLGFIFYGYGFGLFGRVDSLTAVAIGVALYTAQIYFSRFWLQHFRFGPFEWLWRSLSYGRRQPFTRNQIT